MKRIILLTVIIFVLPFVAIAQETITEQDIMAVKAEVMVGLEMLGSDQISDEVKAELRKSFADSITKLWVLEHATVENGMFKITISASDLFIDGEGSLYFKAESQGYLKIGNDDYNIEGDITLLNKYVAYVPEPEKTSIFRIEPKLAGAVMTDFKEIDFDVLFLIQVLKFEKIKMSVDLGAGIHSAGLRIARDLTKNFDIGIYGGVMYPRDGTKWRPALGAAAAFRF